MNNDKCEFCKGTGKEPGEDGCVWCHNTGTKEGQKMLTPPAEQHQGEPVAWRYKTRVFVQALGYVWREVIETEEPDLTEVAARDLTPLYTHADPGEFGDYGTSLAVEKGNVRLLLKERDTLRAQLTERDALLRELADAPPAAMEFRLQQKVRAALSASAEPRASTPEANLMHPVYRGGGGVLKDLTHRGPPAGVMPCSGGPTVLRSGRNDLVDGVHTARVESAEPSAPSLVECDACPRSGGCVNTCMKAPASAKLSAPVEPLYPKCTVLKDANVRYSNSTETAEIDERAAFESAYEADANTDVHEVRTTRQIAWAFWQARAALERKP